VRLPDLEVLVLEVRALFFNEVHFVSQALHQCCCSLDELCEVGFDEVLLVRLKLLCQRCRTDVGR